MKISARNQIKGTVVKVQEGAVNGHVTIEDEEGARISGSITNESIEALGLKEGGKAVAIIKATDVMVAVDWRFFRPRALREVTREPQALVGWGSFAVRGLFRLLIRGLATACGHRAPRLACFPLASRRLHSSRV